MTACVPIDERHGDRRTHDDRRSHDDPLGSLARRGPCRECGAETEHVALWNNRAVRLCAACSTAIRLA